MAIQYRYRFGSRRRISWNDLTPDEKKTEYKCKTCCNWLPIHDMIFEDGEQYCQSCTVTELRAGLKAWG
jgi:hypothetical protein